MKYSATSQRKLHLFIAFLSLYLSILTWNISSIKWNCLMLVTVNVFLAFVKYTLIINKHAIVYSIQLFGIRIYKKEVMSTNIKKIIFKRIGWKSKLAAIKVHTGIPIRVALFKPVTVYDDLIMFCEENSVPYHKTKDYTIVEKMG